MTLALSVVLVLLAAALVRARIALRTADARADVLRSQLATERAEQARLTGTVPAYQGHFVPGHDRERRALEHDSTTHLHRKTRYL